MTASITVLMADDHSLLRETLAERLNREPDIEVVGTAPDAAEARAMAVQLEPDVVLMDIDMPGLSCFEAAQRIKDNHPETSIIFLSAFSNDRYIESALAAQASGYVTKDEPPDTILAAIRSAASQVAYFSPRVQARIVVDKAGVRLARADVSRASLLTSRELEVLRYIARGMPKKEIAATMHVSIHTVSRHTENLMQKLDIHDRVELARYAIREGLAEP